MIEQPDSIFLNDKDLNVVKMNTEIIRGLEKDEAIYKLKLDVLSAQELTLKAQNEVIKRDRVIIEYQAMVTRKNKEEAKEIAKNALYDISNEHDALRGKKWGFNPDTGEIIFQEDE